MNLLPALLDIPLDYLGDILADPLPNPDPVAPPGIAEKITPLIGWLKWGGLIVCLASMVILGARMAWDNRRGQSSEHGGTAAKILGGVIVISMASSIIGFVIG